MVDQTPAQGSTEEVETVLVQHLIRLFNTHHLTALQTKRLLVKMLMLIDAGKKG
jgi:hypothetical protein